MGKANNEQKNQDQHNGSGKIKTSQVVVVMVPLPAQGHLNQLLQLSRIISSYNITVHFVGTSIHNRQAKLRVHGFNPTAISNIHFHDFQIPSFDSPPPNPHSPLKFPSHLQPSFDYASRHLRKPVASLLSLLSPVTRRVVVVHDSLMASVVQDFVSFPNVESYIFHSVSAFSCFWFSFDVTNTNRGNNNNSKLSSDFNNEKNYGDVVVIQREKDFPTLESCFTADFEKFMKYQREFHKFSSGNLYNSSRVFEGKFIDLLEKDLIKKNKKLWAIGPLNPVITTSFSGKVINYCSVVMTWLDKQLPKSVLFVSFGTTTSLTDEQIREIAIGLERSGSNFIWVLRDADKGDIFNAGDDRRRRGHQLPKGYEERVKERGMIVREWAPQLEILRHLSTGGFISHCGWNSCMESISNGVPMIAWPMHSDQPRNTVLITEVLKVGIVLRKWAPHGGRDDGEVVVVKSSEIETAVKLLMGGSKEGAEIRRRAEELGILVRESVEEGGVSRKEMDLFVAHITR